jgi:uncharacterized protein
MPPAAFNVDRSLSLAGQVRIADTFLTRLRGLLGTKPEEFAPGAALWIKPCHAVHSLWMRFSIDVLFLDKEQRVVHIEPEFAPGRVGRVIRNAVSVLELPACTVQSTGTCVGDRIQFVERRQSLHLSKE